MADGLQGHWKARTSPVKLCRNVTIAISVAVTYKNVVIIMESKCLC